MMALGPAVDRADARAARSFRRATLSSSPRGTGSTSAPRRSPVPNQVLDRQGLEGEVTSITEAGWPWWPMFTTRPFAEQVESCSPPRSNSATRGSTWRGGRRPAAQPGDVDHPVELAGVGQQRLPSFMRSKCSARSSDYRPGPDGHEDVSPRSRGLEDRHRPRSLSMRASRRGRRRPRSIDHRGAGAAGALGHALAGEAVAKRTECRPASRTSAGRQDAVERRRAGAVAVVEVRWCGPR